MCQIVVEQVLISIEKICFIIIDIESVRIIRAHSQRPFRTVAVRFIADEKGIIFQAQIAALIDRSSHTAGRLLIKFQYQPAGGRSIHVERQRTVIPRELIILGQFFHFHTAAVFRSRLCDCDNSCHG